MVGWTAQRFWTTKSDWQLAVGCSLRQRGFTLIEIMVVLVIVAIITAVAVLAFGEFGTGRHQKMIVHRLTRTILAAQQQAILEPAVLGLSFNDSGYQFYRYQTSMHKGSAQWAPLRDDVLSDKNAFNRIFAMRLKSVAGFTKVQSDNAAKPAIVFLPSGFVTAFSLELTSKLHSFVVTVQSNGVVSIKDRVLSHG